MQKLQIELRKTLPKLKNSGIFNQKNINSKEVVKIFSILSHLHYKIFPDFSP